MSRALKVRQDCLEKVKLALRRNGFPNQRSLSEQVEFALATVSNFLTGKPVDYLTFEELSRFMVLEWKEIANINFEVSSQTIGKNPELPEFQIGQKSNEVWIMSYAATQAYRCVAQPNYDQRSIHKYGC